MSSCCSFWAGHWHPSSGSPIFTVFYWTYCTSFLVCSRTALAHFFVGIYAVIEIFEISFTSIYLFFIKRISLSSLEECQLSRRIILSYGRRTCPVLPVTIFIAKNPSPYWSVFGVIFSSDMILSRYSYLHQLVPIMTFFSFWSLFCVSKNPAFIMFCISTDCLYMHHIAFLILQDAEIRGKVPFSRSVIFWLAIQSMPQFSRICSSNTKPKALALILPIRLSRNPWNRTYGFGDLGKFKRLHHFLIALKHFSPLMV